MNIGDTFCMLTWKMVDVCYDNTVRRAVARRRDVVDHALIMVRSLIYIAKLFV